MNERIKQLDLEAAYGIIDPNRESTPEECERFKAKFAELIVRECAQVAHNKQYKHSPTHTVGDCATAIKQHFGIGMSTEDKKNLIKELLGVKNG